MKKEKAITLISLVITIIVLIILASVAIYLGVSNNGIFNRANEAKELTNKQTATDIINLKITTAQMSKYAEKQEMPTLKELSEILRDDSEIQYVTETSKVANTEYDVPSDNPSSIYTKLNKYPYEFEINEALQLASIDGVKLATTQDNQQNKISLIYDTQVSDVGEYKLKESVENYDIIVVGASEYNSSREAWSSGHSFILTKGINEKEEIRVGMDDSEDKCMQIQLKNDNLIIIATWHYRIQRIYGINL